jgi:hypothetical protein
MAEIAGIDFAYTHPNPAAVRAAGYQFVIGYVSNSPGKNMTAVLASAYHAAGLGVGLVWETTADRVRSGAAGGAVDGAAASAQAKAIGYPADCHVYFAVDYAAPARDFPVAQAYADAFDAHCAYPVGIYGDFAVIEHFVTPGQRPVRSGWQTVGWSSGLVSAKANLYQRNTYHYRAIAGVTQSSYDENVVMHDAPLWWPGAAPSPDVVVTPPPAPVADWNSIPALVYGNTGQAVLHFQQFMVRMFPAYNRYTPNAIYGPATTAGLKEFQRRSGVSGGDGRNVGPQTKQALWKAGYRP